MFSEPTKGTIMCYKQDYVTHCSQKSTRTRHVEKMNMKRDGVDDDDDILSLLIRVLSPITALGSLRAGAPQIM